MTEHPIYGNNGVREMTPEEIKAREEAMAKIPPPPHEPTVAELAQLLEQERKRGDQLQQDNEELWLSMADMLFGGEL